MLVLLVALLAVAGPPSLASAGCPYLGADTNAPLGALPPSHPAAARRLLAKRQLQQAAATQVNYDAVRLDIRLLLTNSQAFWPADFGNYGGLMIRLAWHTSGSYRRWDGRGGADGARIRFDPERSWGDNTNLDKALTLLQPLKVKYPGISWGDLIVLAGTTAIESMGGPVLGFCAGRVDDMDGTASLELGPSSEQELVAPCQGTDRYNWNCTTPLGPTQIGLVYVNPEGPRGDPVPAQSAPQIRDTFTRMGLNDRETVSLIGGGHAFGKTHGACPTGAGPAPNEDETNPWPGTCGNGTMMGKGPNTFTSGFEGPWTDSPTFWTNDYFHNLVNFNWTVHMGPGGHFQWQPNQIAGGPMPGSTMMLTSDVALLFDPVYRALVDEFCDLPTINDAFAHSWYKLVTADMGPRTRCLNSDAPPAQPFQLPLPDTPLLLANFDNVKTQIRSYLRMVSTISPADMDSDNRPYYGALFATLAWQCASTFRATDYKGGCNGARIRFSPQKDWNGNQGLDTVLALLSEIKAMFPDISGALSWADLIVLAGTTAIEEATPGLTLEFCGGRTDATDANDTEFLGPRDYSTAIIEAVDNAKVMGLSARQYVALQGGLRSPVHMRAMGYSGSWNSASVSTLSNAFFTTLLSNDWALVNTSSVPEYQAASNSAIVMTPKDLALKFHAEFLPAVQEFAGDAAAFTNTFASVWTTMMNADRFVGPTGSVCQSTA